MKAHRTDGVSLSFGVIFLLVVGWWVAGQAVDVDLPALGWFAAGALILFGGIGLLGALRSGRTAPVEPVVDRSVEPVSGLPPELHADIVRELLTGPGGTPADPATSAATEDRWPRPPHARS